MRLRKTTLPNLPLLSRAQTTSAFSQLLKTEYSKPILEQLRGNTFLIPLKSSSEQAWDEAVRAIERIHAAREEWPWPKR
jgi:hypothetical protein